jgi:hypothetical protein
MRLIVATEPGTVELNYMWLPTWIGMNSVLKKEIEDAVSPMLVGKELSDEVLEAASEKVMDFLEVKFSGLSGLRDYLDALKFVGP